MTYQELHFIEHLQERGTEGEKTRYPGRRTLGTRGENFAQGIPVEPSIWRQMSL